MMVSGEYLLSNGSHVGLNLRQQFKWPTCMRLTSEFASSEFNLLTRQRTSGLPELPHICEVEVMYFIICNLVSICGLCLSQSEAWRLDNLGLQIRTEMPRKEEGGGGVQRTYRVDATGQS